MRPLHEHFNEVLGKMVVPAHGISVFFKFVSVRDT